MGGIVGIEFKTPFKLCVLFQQRTLCVMMITCAFFYLKSMNHVFWEEFVMRPTFANYTASAQDRFIENMTSTNPTKAMSLGVAVFEAYQLTMSLQDNIKSL